MLPHRELNYLPSNAFHLSVKGFKVLFINLSLFTKKKKKKSYYMQKAINHSMYRTFNMQCFVYSLQQPYNLSTTVVHIFQRENQA